MASAVVDPKESNGGALTATAATFLALTYVSVGLRTYVKGFITKSFLADDWLMIVSQIVFTISCIFILLGVSVGLGRHNEPLRNENRQNEIDALMWQALAAASYILNMMFIKLSIAVFLLRLSTEKKYTYAIYGSAFVIFVFGLSFFFWDMFQCKPAQAQWDYTIPGHTCVSSQEIINGAYAISVVNILTDWLYALMPIPMIWKVKMTTQAKATVVVILGLGVFASVATLVRVKFLADLNDTADLLFAGTDTMVWTLIEPGIAIIAASLVTIRPLLRKLKLPGFQSTGNTGMSGPTGGRARSGGQSGYRSGNNTNPSNGRMPGFGHGDVTLVDLESGNGKETTVGGTSSSATSSLDLKKKHIKATTTTSTTISTATTIGKGGAGGFSPHTSATSTSSPPPSTNRRLADIRETIDRTSSTIMSRNTSKGRATTTEELALQQLPPTPPPLGMRPGGGFPHNSNNNKNNDSHISIRSETYIIEGRMVDDPPTPTVIPGLHHHHDHHHDHDRPPSSASSAPSHPLTIPTIPSRSLSIRSEDHEGVETHSQHDGRVGLAVREERWK